MTRRDYIIVAKIIKNANLDQDIKTMFSSILCDGFKKDNNEFDSNKFINFIHDGGHYDRDDI